MPQLAAMNAAAPPLNPAVMPTGTPADDGRGAQDRAAWSNRLRDPDSAQPELARGPSDVASVPPDLDRPTARASRWLFRPSPQGYSNPDAQLLPDSSGVHAEILVAVSSPGGEQNPAWTTRNTFRLPAEPWDAQLYITPEAG